MLSIIAYSLLILTVITTIIAILGRHNMYWVAAVCIYVFSFLAGFSIGQLTVGLTFVFLTLAFGYTFGLVKGKFSASLTLVVGILIGAVLVVFVDDYWLFYPLSLFM